MPEHESGAFFSWREHCSVVFQLQALRGLLVGAEGRVAVAVAVERDNIQEHRRRDTVPWCVTMWMIFGTRISNHQPELSDGI